MKIHSLLDSLGGISPRVSSLAVPGEILKVKAGWESSRYRYFPSLKPQEKAEFSIKILVEYFEQAGLDVEVISRDSRSGDLKIIEDGVEKLAEVKVGVEKFSIGTRVTSTSFWFNQIRNDDCDLVILVFATPSCFVSFQFARDEITKLPGFKRGHVGSDTLFEVRAQFNSRSCPIKDFERYGKLLDVVRF